MIDHEDPEVLAVMRVIAHYLRENPLACDTAEGIRRWWLSSETPAAVLQRALDRLHAQGLVEALRAADGHTRYRRAADARPDAAPAVPSRGGRGSA